MFDETSLNPIAILWDFPPPPLTAESQKPILISLQNIVFRCHASLMPPIVNETLTVLEIASGSVSLDFIIETKYSQFYGKMFLSVMANTFYERLAEVLFGRLLKFLRVEQNTLFN